MDSNNWSGGAVGTKCFSRHRITADWRIIQLPAHARQRIVNKIMDTLLRHLPVSGQEGLLELKKIAIRFEEKIYAAATSQSDYLRKISLKMLTMETKSQNPIANSLPSNPPGNSNLTPDPGPSGGAAGAGGEATTIDTADWRTHLHPDSRQRIVNKIMDTLVKHLPILGQEGLHEHKKIAVRFEEKVYAAATSQSDYLRKISRKMLTVETKSQNPIAKTLPSNRPGNSNQTPYPDARRSITVKCGICKQFGHNKRTCQRAGVADKRKGKSMKNGIGTTKRKAEAARNTPNTHPRKRAKNVSVETPLRRSARLSGL